MREANEVLNVSSFTFLCSAMQTLCGVHSEFSEPRSVKEHYSASWSVAAAWPVHVFVTS
jgi:hypothetical protein